MNTVLTIAGSDCSGGAGIQADLKTIAAHSLYGMSVITALTAQNTVGVAGIVPTAPDFVKLQLDAVFTDIRPDAVKIGMLQNSDIIETVAERLSFYCAARVVLDPVMISTSGHCLLDETAVHSLCSKLIPIADLITPNLSEAEALCGFYISDMAQMEKAAKAIIDMGAKRVLIKGGHLNGSANDLLLENGKFIWFQTERVENPNTHGTGCTLSSAIACGLAEGYSMKESVARAKTYLTGALKAGLNLGQGHGPLDHTYAIRTEEK